MIRGLLFIGMLLMMACSSSKKVFSENQNALQDPSSVKGLQDDKGTYVYVNKGDLILVGKKPSSVEGVCQDLFSEMAFNWSIVLSPEKKTNLVFYKKVHDELHKCYEKFLMIQSVDLYEKTFTELSDDKKAELKKLYPFYFIETKPR